MVFYDKSDDLPGFASSKPNACLALSDGTLFWGYGFGTTGVTSGELCFNTAMTGYQEIMTDPSYAGQLVAFTFPHIGNTGVNPEDDETVDPVARAMVVKWSITEASNWRAAEHLSAWLAKKGRIGISGIDTRCLTRRIRDLGMPHAALAHAADGEIDTSTLIESAKAFQGLEGLDLAKEVTCRQSYRWEAGRWTWADGHQVQAAGRHRVVAVDFGTKRNILRCLTDAGCDLFVVPATTTAEEVLAYQPDGVFLSNGPGDPAATGTYAVPMIQRVIDAGLPVFGICLGHQMLGLALGADTIKMSTGHHGANHPVKDLE
ncbi:MAG: glutamine-hydrolyzing carbamoyl-phosphate synthase small subunit, partial [Pseudomonadota bacterium]